MQIRNQFFYWGLGGRLLAAATLDPHSSNSLLVSSLCTKTSIKQSESFSAPVAVAIASVKSSSVRTYTHKSFKDSIKRHNANYNVF